MKLICMFTFAVLAFSGCASKSKPYALHSEPYSKQVHTEIIGDPGFLNGLIVILKIDDKETRTAPVIIEAIKNNPSPNWFAPTSVTIQAGKHKLGVVYLLTDISGKLGTTKMAREYEKRYLPEGKREYITVQHYEEFEIDTFAGMIYKLGQVYDETKKLVRITIEECADTKTCKPISAQVTKVKDSAIEGWATTQDLDITNR